MLSRSNIVAVADEMAAAAVIVGAAVDVGKAVAKGEGDGLAVPGTAGGAAWAEPGSVVVGSSGTGSFDRLA